MGSWFDRLLLIVGVGSVIAVLVRAVRGRGRAAPRNPPWRTRGKWELAVPVLLLLSATYDGRSPVERWGLVLFSAAFALEFVLDWVGWWRRGKHLAPVVPSDRLGSGEPEASGAWVCMPDVGDRVGEAVVTSWLLHEGDAVVAGQPLFEVSTDKVDIEIPSPATGALARIAVPAGESVPVGTRLALISPGMSSVATDPAPAAETDERSVSGPGSTVHRE